MNSGSEVFENRVFVDVVNSSSMVATNKKPSDAEKVVENVTEAIESMAETTKTVEKEISKSITSTEVKLEDNIDQHDILCSRRWIYRVRGNFLSWLGNIFSQFIDS